MGGSNSTVSQIQHCIDAVCNYRDNCWYSAKPGTIGYLNWGNDPAWLKPYNLEYIWMPDVVVRPNDALEVARIVKCANQWDMKVQARSGGHSYGNLAMGPLKNGGIMIDLMYLKDFSMDPTTWQATFGPAHKLGELDQLLHKNGGRAIAHGTCPGVGIGGHATVGGLGPSSRMWGTALDHVIEMEVVTSDGKIVRASEEANVDLFWAMRGAGASFGIVTEFVVKTHPEPGNIVEYTYSFSFGKQEDMTPVFMKWQELVMDPKLDRRFSTMFIAEPLGALITGTFYGTKEEYEATGIPGRIPSGGFINFVLMDWLGSLAHMAETAGLYLSDLPTHFASKSLAFRKEDKLPESAVREMFQYMDDTYAATILWFVIFNSEGGAVNDVPMDATAYPHRDKLMMYQSYGIGFPRVNPPLTRYIAGIHDKIKKGAPEATTSYAGYVDMRLSRPAAQKAYWGHNLPELERIKQEWDPSDRFHNLQGVDLPVPDKLR